MIFNRLGFLQLKEHLAKRVETSSRKNACINRIVGYESFARVRARHDLTSGRKLASDSRASKTTILTARKNA